MNVHEDALNSYPATLASVESLEKAIELYDSQGVALCTEGRTPLFYACLREVESEALALAEHVWNSMTPEQRAITDIFGQHAFFYAARQGHLRVCKFLKTLGVDSTDGTHQTAIFYAAREGHGHVIKYLVDEGADVNLVDNNGDTPLFYAARDGRIDAVNLMIELGADASYRNKSRRYPSTIAKMMGHKKLTGILEAARRAKPKRGAATKMASTALDDNNGTPHGSGDEQPAAPRSRGGGRRVGESSTSRKRKPSTKPDGELVDEEVASTTPSTTRSTASRRSGGRASASGADNVENCDHDSGTSKSGKRRRLGSFATTDDDGSTSSKKQVEVNVDSLASPPGAEKQAAASVAGVATPTSASSGPPRELCCLQYRSPLDNWSFTPVFKIKEFEAIFPNIAIWDRGMPLYPITLESDPYREEWQRLASELMRHLSEDVENSHVFNDPVDPKRWKLDDYFDIVTDPMDFGTIKRKLQGGADYRCISDFADDLDKVFSNCILYHKANSDLGKIATAIRTAAEEYAQAIGLRRMSLEEKSIMEESNRIVNEMIESRARMRSEFNDEEAAGNAFIEQDDGLGAMHLQLRSIPPEEGLEQQREPPLSAAEAMAENEESIRQKATSTADTGIGLCGDWQAEPAHTSPPPLLSL